MLWTDRYFVSAADLTAVDPEIPDVAIANNITIDSTPASVTQLTQSECGMRLYSQLQRFGGILSDGGFNSNHLNAVWNTGVQSINRVRVLLGQIVVDDLRVSTIRNWVVYSALRYYYREAFARTKDDRYKIKMEQYEQDIRRSYWPMLKAIGLPVVLRPFPCPGAVLERSGQWGQSNVTVMPVDGIQGGTFYVAITWVDQSRYLGPAFGTGPGASNNAESFYAQPIPITAALGQAISVNLTGLIPPNGAVDASQLPLSIAQPWNATGWNLYVSASKTGPFFLQNSSPIPIAQTSFTLPSDPVLTGNQPNGQYAEAYYTMTDVLQRG